MDDVVVEGKVLEWGNSFGIRIKRAELEAAGIPPGTEVILHIERKPARIDLSKVRLIKDGRSDVSERHDEFLGSGRHREHLERTGQKRRP